MLLTLVSQGLYGLTNIAHPLGLSFTFQKMAKEFLLESLEGQGAEPH